MIRLLRSTALRLALGYAALFVVSSLLLVGFLWWHTANYLDRETDAVILADAQAIAERLRDFGLPGALETVADRVAHASDEHAIYLLTDPTLHPLAGNLQAWPLSVGSQPGWYEIELAREGKLHATRGLFLELPSGFRLLVGRDIQDRVEVRSLILRGLIWASIVALGLAVLGGFLLRRSLLHRVEAINRTASAIVRGNFSERVPVQGSSDEFDQLAETINAMLARIEHLVERVRNASNAVAHDLRTPLAELRARLEDLARARPPVETMHDEIEKAVVDIDGIIGIFNALLRLAEIDSGARRSAFRRVELSEIAAQVSEIYEPLAEEKAIVIAPEISSGMAVEGDPDLIAQAIGNLIDNAIKFAPPKSRIALRIVPGSNGMVGIEIADSGPGIVDVERSRVTEPFYRSDRSAGTEGRGLGLSVVDAVARLHGGTLELKDNAPGLIAILTLPLIEGGERTRPGRMPASVAT
ncbi:MAG TPA: ATP-binding protein [Stellaceae bacterium]|nr:ATP-binding protein [Stellaceae bacterium]